MPDARIIFVSSWKTCHGGQATDEPATYSSIFLALLTPPSSCGQESSASWESCGHVDATSRRQGLLLVVTPHTDGTEWDQDLQFPHRKAVEVERLLRALGTLDSADRAFVYHRRRPRSCPSWLCDGNSSWRRKFRCMCHKFASRTKVPLHVHQLAAVHHCRYESNLPPLATLGSDGLSAQCIYCVAPLAAPTLEHMDTPVLYHAVGWHLHTYAQPDKLDVQLSQPESQSLHWLCCALRQSP
ncbi:hypothetical protein NM688_g6199 [Phlebia brevispora]|uniref:Uncharacterized protein n=1 Tax=Phlebia brevispora TaxID=194682 RepID=A0ACC1SIT2_9APHY|nr:hypothetical protein NM688_g6199 [Phlebia brevispora]